MTHDEYNYELMNYVYNLDFDMHCSLNVNDFLTSCISELERIKHINEPLLICFNNTGNIVINPQSKFAYTKQIFSSESSGYDPMQLIDELSNINSAKVDCSQVELWIAIDQIFGKKIVFGLRKVIVKYPGASHYSYNITTELASILDMAIPGFHKLIKNPTYIADTEWLSCDSTSDYLAAYLNEVPTEINKILIELITSSENIDRLWDKLKETVKTSYSLDVKTRVLLGKLNMFQIIRFMEKQEVDFYDLD